MKKHEPILREGEANKRKSSHKAIADVGAANRNFGINAEEAGKAASALFEQFPGFLNVNKAAQEQMMKTYDVLSLWYPWLATELNFEKKARKPTQFMRGNSMRMGMKIRKENRNNKVQDLFRLLYCR